MRFGIADTALWAVGDDRRLERLGQRRPRRAHARRRRGAARQHLLRRGDLRRRRLRPVRDVLLHPDRRLRGRPDGRAARRSTWGRRSRRARSRSPPSARSSCPRWCSCWPRISVVTHAGLASIFNSGAHGFTEALYAYTSQANNNGSAFAGYGATNFSRRTSARSRCTSAGSCRCSPRSRSAARWREEDRARVGRHVPHRRRRRSSCCSSASSCSPPG